MTPKKYALTSNQYFRGQNRRAQNRSQLMARAGYTYDGNRHAFTRRHWRGLYVVPAQAAFHADKRALFEAILPGMIIKI